jgi:hypothetical protein
MCNIEMFEKKYLAKIADENEVQKWRLEEAEQEKKNKVPKRTGGRKLFTIKRKLHAIQWARENRTWQ